MPLPSILIKVTKLLAPPFAILIFAAEVAVAASACGPVDKTNDSYRVNYFTNYAPIQGGINGSCGKSASGKDACKFFLEDYLAGRTNAVMIAIPQYDCPPEGFKKVRPKNGKSYKVACRSKCPGFYNPDMFGGLYRSEEFELSLRRQGIQASCIPLAADDRYAKSESCKSKIDMVTRQATSRLSGIVNSIRNSQLVVIGRSNNISPPVRRIDRDPSAVSGLDNYVENPRPIPRRGRRKVHQVPEMPTQEEDETAAATAAAAAASYDLYEARRNQAIMERDKRNTEILKQYEAEKKLTKPKEQE